MNEAHMNKVLAYVDRGRSEGAEHRYGGEQVLAETGGYYLTRRCLMSRAQHRHRLEETFGPLLSAITFDSEEEAVAIANNSTFGLAAYIATSNLARGHRVARSSMPA